MMINKMMRSKLNVVCAMAMASALALSGCSGEIANNLKSSIQGSDNIGVIVEGNDSSAIASSAESSVEIGEVTATVTLSDDGSTVSGNGVKVDGTDVIIEDGGTYSFSGSLTEGRIKVEATGKDVTIVLNGVTITNSDKDAIYIEEANSAVVYVMEGTVNSLTSGTEETYETAKAAVEEANSSDDTESSSETTESASSDSETTDDGFSNSQKATIMAKCDLMISGAGTLNVYGYINNGIQSKTNLTVECVNLVMVAANDGIKGGTDITITSGVFDLKAVGDAVQSDGTLNIEDGTFTVVTGDGAASAEKKSEMGFGGGNGGFGGGRMNRQNSTTESGTDSSTTTQTSSQTASASGQMPEMPADGQMPEMPADGQMPEMPADGQMPQIPENGQVTSDDSSASSDTATTTQFQGRMGMAMDFENSLDSDSNAVSQKGFKAAGDMVISGGSFEMDTVDDAVHADGVLTVCGGSFAIKAGDDALHTETDLVIDGGTITIDECYEGIEGATITVNDGEIDVTSSDDGFNASSSEVDPLITINGGDVYVNSSGDGLDSNKDIVINGGTVYVDGPANSGNAAIDIGTENQGTFVVNGGTVTAIGMSGMLENADSSSTQQVLTYVFDESLEEGTEIKITDSNGSVVATVTTTKSANAITYSSADLETGETYTFTAGSLTGELTADDINATNGAATGMGGFGGMGGRGGNGGFGGRGMNGGNGQGSTEAGTDQSSSTNSGGDQNGSTDGTSGTMPAGPGGQGGFGGPGMQGGQQAPGQGMQGGPGSQQAPGQNG